MRTRIDYANVARASVGQTTAQPLLGASLAYAVSPSLDLDSTRFKVHTTRRPMQTLGAAVRQVS